MKRHVVINTSDETFPGVSFRHAARNGRENISLSLSLAQFLSRISRRRISFISREGREDGGFAALKIAPRYLADHYRKSAAKLPVISLPPSQGGNCYRYDSILVSVIRLRKEEERFVSLTFRAFPNANREVNLTKVQYTIRGCEDELLRLQTQLPSCRARQLD